jgi:spore coat polysaccharide biosynthesis protein SpsF (cytidylyltransferase family)
MNTMPFHTTNSLHDKIAEKEQAYQLAIDENKDYHFIKDLKATLDTLKKELRQMETAFHDEFKNQPL